jgi:DNA-binding LacI/PurR family transcriptional regulator
MNISQVAKLCEVSAATINNILNTKEGYPDGITSG